MVTVIGRSCSTTSLHLSLVMDDSCDNKGDDNDYGDNDGDDVDNDNDDDSDDYDDNYDDDLPVQYHRLCIE